MSPDRDGSYLWDKDDNDQDVAGFFVLFHIVVYILGDKYGLLGLQEKAAHAIRAAVDETSSSWSLEQLECIVKLLSDVTGDAIDFVAATLARMIESSEEFSNSPILLKCARQWSGLSYEWMMRQRDRRAIKQAYVRNHSGQGPWGQ